MQFQLCPVEVFICELCQEFFTWCPTTFPTRLSQCHNSCSWKIATKSPMQSIQFMQQTKIQRQALPFVGASPRSQMSLLHAHYTVISEEGRGGGRVETGSCAQTENHLLWFLGSRRQSSSALTDLWFSNQKGGLPFSENAAYIKSVGLGLRAVWEIVGDNQV